MSTAVWLAVMAKATKSAVSHTATQKEGRKYTEILTDEKEMRFFWCEGIVDL